MRAATGSQWRSMSSGVTCALFGWLRVEYVCACGVRGCTSVRVAYVCGGRVRWECVCGVRVCVENMCGECGVRGAYGQCGVCGVWSEWSVWAVRSVRSVWAV